VRGDITRKRSRFPVTNRSDVTDGQKHSSLLRLRYEGKRGGLCRVFFSIHRQHSLRPKPANCHLPSDTEDPAYRFLPDETLLVADPFSVILQKGRKLRYGTAPNIQAGRLEKAAPISKRSECQESYDLTQPWKIHTQVRYTGAIINISAAGKAWTHQV
jgi:hypothetical protein